MDTFESETNYSDHWIIGCTAPGVKLAGIQDKRYIGTSRRYPLCVSGVFSADV